MVWTGPSIRPHYPDPVLADLAARHKLLPVWSKVVGTDLLMTAVNREKLGNDRIVDLSCGHKVVTSSWQRVRCPRCAEMIRQGGDYEGWVNSREHVYDGMTWRGDPCRPLNEPTDLEGNFVHEAQE